LLNIWYDVYMIVIVPSPATVMAQLKIASSVFEIFDLYFWSIFSLYELIINKIVSWFGFEGSVFLYRFRW